MSEKTIPFTLHLDDCIERMKKLEDMLITHFRDEIE